MPEAREGKTPAEPSSETARIALQKFLDLLAATVADDIRRRSDTTNEVPPRQQRPKV